VAVNEFLRKNAEQLLIELRTFQIDQRHVQLAAPSAQGVEHQTKFDCGLVEPIAVFGRFAGTR